jgi:putative lipoic acid-binding regulatory protein
MKDEAPRFEYPCDFEIKAMGLDDGQLHEVVIEIVERHCDTIRMDTLRTRASSSGKYVSVSLTIVAQNRAQLDAIYDDLTSHDKILMRL